MFPRSLFPIALLCAGSFLGCDRPECTNTNPVLEQHSPESKAYRDELVVQLARLGPDEVRYWIDTWEDRDGEQFLWVYVQGEGLCAKAMLELHGEHRYAAPKPNSKNAGGYHGAEVIGLRYAIVQDSTRTAFIYQGQDRIID